MIFVCTDVSKIPSGPDVCPGSRFLAGWPGYSTTQKIELTHIKLINVYISCGSSESLFARIPPETILPSLSQWMHARVGKWSIRSEVPPCFIYPIEPSKRYSVATLALLNTYLIPYRLVLDFQATTNVLYCRHFEKTVF